MPTQFIPTYKKALADANIRDEGELMPKTKELLDEVRSQEADLNELIKTLNSLEEMGKSDEEIEEVEDAIQEATESLQKEDAALSKKIAANSINRERVKKMQDGRVAAASKEKGGAVNTSPQANSGGQTNTNTKNIPPQPKQNNNPPKQTEKQEGNKKGFATVLGFVGVTILGIAGFKFAKSKRWI